MSVNAVNKESNLKHNISTSVKAGAIAAGIQGLLLPAEAKAAIKNTIAGEDAFLRNTAKCAKKTMENLGKEINIESAVQNAKEMYPGMKKAAMNIGKGLAGTFGAVALGVLTGKVITDKILNSKAKAQNAEQQN